jgi:serpin B
MFIILPDANDGLPALEEDLLLGKIQLPHKLDEPKVRVTFPKFKVEHSLPATEMLKELGMGLAFDDKADFSGISHGDDALKVSSVIHKAFCEVNEEGTEAAAATAVVMVRCMSFTPEPQPEVFRADHPFLYMIRENEGNILFMGRMENPKG